MVSATRFPFTVARGVTARPAYTKYHKYDGTSTCHEEVLPVSTCYNDLAYKYRYSWERRVNADHAGPSQKLAISNVWSSKHGFLRESAVRSNQQVTDKAAECTDVTNSSADQIKK